jgi:hypothetical protein
MIEASAQGTDCQGAQGIRKARTCAHHTSRHVMQVDCLTNRLEWQGNSPGAGGCSRERGKQFGKDGTFGLFRWGVERRAMGGYQCTFTTTSGQQPSVAFRNHHKNQTFA